MRIGPTVMASPTPIHLLVVEPDDHEHTPVESLLEGATDGEFTISRAGRLSDALALLGTSVFDLVMLDLNLPDSSGVDTFVSLHTRAPHLPVLVVTSAEAEAMGRQAVEEGAQDYVVRPNLSSSLVARSLRYAVDRAHLQQALGAARQRRHQDLELQGIDRLSRPPGTAVTARMYGASPLSEAAQDTFAEMVAEYSALLDDALDRRTYDTAGSSGGERVRDLALRLGQQRGTPRDVIEIHSAALKARTADGPWQRAQAYLVEGRLLVLELMGYLAGFYRTHGPIRQTGREGQA